MLGPSTGLQICTRSDPVVHQCFTSILVLFSYHMVMQPALQPFCVHVLNICNLLPLLQNPSSLTCSARKSTASVAPLCLEPVMSGLVVHCEYHLHCMEPDMSAAICIVFELNLTSEAICTIPDRQQDDSAHVYGSLLELVQEQDTCLISHVASETLSVHVSSPPSMELGTV